MNNNQTTSSGGIGFAGLLTIVFITLKLCHVIDWSWWWVLAPTLIPIVIILAVLLFCGIIVVVCRGFTKPLTPAQKLAKSCNEMSAALRNRR